MEPFKNIMQVLDDLSGSSSDWKVPSEWKYKGICSVPEAISAEDLQKDIQKLSKQIQEINFDTASTKPWETWTNNLTELWKNPKQRVLFDYLTSHEVLKQVLMETQAKVINAFKSQITDTKGKAILMRGGTSEDWNLYSTDMTKTIFRQDSFFRYLFGVNEPDLWGLVDLENEKFILFIPSTPEIARSFMGPPKTDEWYKTNYSIDECHTYLEENIKNKLAELNISKIYLLKYENSDSSITHEPIDISNLGNFEIDVDYLGPLLASCRSIKTPLEIEYLRVATYITCQAHVYVMRRMRPGMNEVQAEAYFRSYVCFAGGARHVAYDCICCSGEHGSILHYGHAGRPNDGIIQEEDMLLFDMGGEYNGYATDITISFPALPKMSESQRIIYSAVLDAQKKVEKVMKAGVVWIEMHKLAEKTILEHLIKAEILVGTINEVVQANLGRIFMPHGLGHLMGLDTHDVGGFSNRKKCSENNALRTSRVLESGMVITVEPGCYFIDYLIKSVLNDPNKSKFINKPVLDKFATFGGVRLEDDVVVTDTGIVNLTVIPREIEDVEAVLANKVM